MFSARRSPLARAITGLRLPPGTSRYGRRRGFAALLRLEPLIVEAGTGTGKTFAYLVPALLSGPPGCDHFYPAHERCRIRLFSPRRPNCWRKALGLPVKVALLKGRANYLCRHPPGTPPFNNPRS